MRTRDEALKALVQNCLYLKIKTIRLDRGKEYIKIKFAVKIMR